VTREAQIIDFRAQQFRLFRAVRIMTAHAHGSVIGEMHPHERLGLMTLLAHDGLFRLQYDVSGMLALFDNMAGTTSAFHRRMNVRSRGMIGVTFNTIRLRINGWMLARIAETGT
jgi:hypothetical protein